MPQTYYTSEESFRILIAILKANGIRKVIISPGTTNLTFTGSLQSDPFFELYSEIDERSAAYMACGMAEESGDPVVLSCTGATAARNYIPAMTEAFYRHLPVLAVTSSQHFGHVGTYTPQITDRRAPEDCAAFSVNIPMFRNDHDRWAYTLKLNEAILALTRNGGGPVHINMATDLNADFSVRELPKVRAVIRTDSSSEHMPDISAKTIGIFVGAHRIWSDELAELVDAFCEKYNAAVLCDHTSNYSGKYGVLHDLVRESPRKNMDLLIHIGQISATYTSFSAKEVWRVNPDGLARSPFRKLDRIFQMTEEEFFSRYVIHGGGVHKTTEYYSAWRSDYDYARSLIPDLPFSNLWIAQQTAPCLPENSVLHLGILNSIRSWNFFELPPTVRTYCNTGGFGIDGCLSSLLGASFASPDKLFFGVIGDLSFYYDINALANKRIGPNLRLIVVNNGGGQTFRNRNHVATKIFGEGADPFIAAAEHFAGQSREFLKHYAQDLGFEYLSASNKEEYLSVIGRFISPEKLSKPVFLEVFPNTRDESEAMTSICSIDTTKLFGASARAKRTVKRLIGPRATRLIKKILGKGQRM